ncbi:TipJ family phage tail tip protein [Pararhizobium gei]|uniref:TipJ family phage tail tip protein n=1 Tax=Pararhizobium gei TaxID=1395951 RepID=UPI0023DC9D9F|nr:hypothetical protein [Rhizobium gei]
MSAQAARVIAMPVADPGIARIHGVAPAGASVAEIVDKFLPGFPAAEHETIRVVLVSRRGSTVVSYKRWTRVKPKPHVTVIIRPIPGKDALRSILQIVISIAAVSLGQYWGAALASGMTATGAAIVKAGLTVALNAIGMLALNALIPPAAPSSNERKTNYTISGWKNRIEPNGVIPDVVGKHRYAPPFAVPPYWTIKGDDLWVTGTFLVGYGSNDPAGGIAMSDYKIGDTSLSEFDAESYVVEVREGVPGDLPLSLVPYTIWQENIGVELTRPYPRAADGDIEDDEDTIETPVVRNTGSNASGCSVILGWQGGLGKVNDSGDYKSKTVEFRIRQRLVGTVEWQEVETIKVKAKKLGEGFSRQHSWTFPVRGTWAIELTRLTDEHIDSQTQSRSTWEALQTIRPEYPINEKKPMALVALHIKATHQLSGTLDNFNLLASRRCKDYDHTSGEWITRETSNPASLLRYKQQGLGATRPAPDSGIDIAKLEDWHDFCRVKGLKYDRVHDDSANHLERLVEVARAGRASPRHDGRQRTVIIDRPDEIAIDEVSERNAGDISVRRVYLRPPHAFRITFNDATNNYEPSERWVRWPGYEGEITITEQLALPGKTHPDEVFVEAKRRMFEAIYRQEVITYLQSGATRVATRGDHVKMSLSTFHEAQISARILAVEGPLVELDAPVSMEAGKNYVVLFRVFPDNDDQVGMNVLRTVKTEAGSSRLIQMTGLGAQPKPGESIYFGEAGNETSQVLITQVEAGEGFSGYYRGVPAAPEIDELTDALEIEPWSSLVGHEIAENFQTPPAPRWISLGSGLADTGTGGTVEALLTAGNGPVYSARYKIEHRLSGAPAWVTINVPAINGGVEIEGVYTKGQHVELRAQALSLTGVAGPFGPTATVIVGANDIDLPAALDASTISVGRLLGGAVITGQTTDDTATSHLQLYHSRTTTVNTATDAVGQPIAVNPSRSFSIPHGDTTRSNLLDNGTFDSATGWVLGTGWGITAGKATHAQGTAGVLNQDRAMTAAKFYRFGYTLSGRITGALTIKLLGTSTQTGVGKSVNGPISDRIQAVTGSATVSFDASPTFNGSIDDAFMFLETTTCLAAGNHYYWLEPRNDDGVAGPLAGPFSVTIQ